jgi:hypothetical protein
MPETTTQFIARKNKQFENESQSKTTRRFKDIGRKGYHHWVREAWTFMVQTNLAEKVFVVERLRLAHQSGEIVHSASPNEIQYRLGYWIVGKIGSANDKWRWGQFCAIIPAADFPALLKKASKEGTIRKKDYPRS